MPSFSETVHNSTFNILSPLSLLAVLRLPQRKDTGKQGCRDAAAMENRETHLPTAEVKCPFWPALRLRFDMDNLTHRIGLCI